MITAQEALARLKEGNRHFIVDDRDASTHTTAGERKAVCGGQEPFAVILGCADSRVPANLIFDQGLGDLFVIRVAGNVVAPSLVGSVEFAVEMFGTPLVVVMGHTGCGAIQATIDEMSQKVELRSPNLADIVGRIKPSIQPLLERAEPLDPGALLALGTRANIRQSVDQLRRGSTIIEQHIRDDGLLVLGAEYDLATGGVTFFENE